MAAWGNMPLNERVLDRLADIIIAADEVRDMVEAEHGFEPFDGFYTSLRSIKLDAGHVMQQLRPDGARGCTDADARDPELTEVLNEIARRISANIVPPTGDARDALTKVEMYAAPYALAFFYEIQRLDALITRLRRGENAAAKADASSREE